MKNIDVRANYMREEKTSYFNTTFIVEIPVEVDKNDKFKSRTELEQFFRNITLEYIFESYHSIYKITLSINNELVIINTCALKYLSNKKLIGILIENNIISENKSTKQIPERECYENY